MERPPGSSSDSTRREQGRRLLRDSLRYSSPGRRFRLRREPTLRLGADDSIFGGSGWSQPHAGPAPNDSVQQFSFTQRFAPAHPTESESPASATATPPNNRPSDDQTDAEMPLLRRVGHRSIAHARDRGLRLGSLIDGLGDRERSFGPEDHNNEDEEDDDDDDDDDDDEMHDAWETLLTTIQPDEQLPSAGSSFASATATSGLTNSMNSTITAPSSFGSIASRMVFADPFPEFTANCDYTSSEASDTEAESEAEEGNRRGDDANSRRRRREEREPTQPSASEDTLRVNQTQSRARETEPSGPIASLTDSLGPEFQQVHSILDRLARRDDIPDEWWETAGLSRIIRRTLNNSHSEDSGA